MDFWLKHLAIFFPDGCRVSDATTPMSRSFPCWRTLLLSFEDSITDPLSEIPDAKLSNDASLSSLLLNIMFTGARGRATRSGISDDGGLINSQMATPFCC